VTLEFEDELLKVKWIWLLEGKVKILRASKELEAHLRVGNGEEIPTGVAD